MRVCKLVFRDVETKKELGNKTMDLNNPIKNFQVLQEVAKINGCTCDVVEYDEV